MLYSVKGYQAGSPDKKRPFNVIPSSHITMKQVNHPVLGMDNRGRMQLMLPGMEYRFPGSTVVELPVGQREKGGPGYLQQGGAPILRQGQEAFGAGDTFVSANAPEMSKLLYLSDLANYSIASGQNPLQTKQGRILFSSPQKLPGTDADIRKLYYSIYLFNQRNDVKNLSPEDRLDLYYNTLHSNDPDIEAYKKKVRSMGYGIKSYFRNAPDIDSHALQSNAKAPASATTVATFQEGGQPDDTPWQVRRPLRTAPWMPTATFPFAPLSVAARFPTVHPVALPVSKTPSLDGPGNDGAWRLPLSDAQLLVSGMAMAGNALEMADNRKVTARQRQQGWSDLSGTVIPGSRGDYTTNEGFFRPDQYTPVQLGAVPVAQEGGYFDSPLPFTGVSGELPVAPDAGKWGASNVPAAGDARQAFRYYVEEKGLAPHIAAGIVGNLVQESGLRPGAREKGNTGNGRGIAQWDVRDRWKGFLSWARKHQRDPQDVRAQLDYVLEEPGESTRALARLQKTSTPEQAAFLFGKTYERPSEQHAHWNKRTGVARQLLEGTFQQGGEYTVTPQELLSILAAGGEVEFL